MPRIRLRPITMKDAEVCCRWVSNETVHRYLGLLHPVRTVEQERAWIASILTDKQHQRSFVIENEQGRPIGTCGLRGIDPDEGTAFFGIMIGEPHLWGRGYGTEATRALLRHAFGKLDLTEVRLSCHQDNRAALRCYGKAGFLPSAHTSDQAQFGDREVRMAITRDAWLSQRPPLVGDRAPLPHAEPRRTPSDT